jgi:hypothetical protein
MAHGPEPVLLIACGALAREIEALRLRSGWRHLVVDCLPASLHNTPDRIPEAVHAKLESARGHYRNVFVAYADCGTGGRLDAMLAEHGVERLPGAHCYELFAGAETFATLHDEEPGTFYLTDFLVRHFERLVIRGLGLDLHPELRDSYFGNYRRAVHLAQSGDPALADRARDCARRLDLAFETRATGLEPFREALIDAGAGAPEAAPWRS